MSNRNDTPGRASVSVWTLLQEIGFVPRQLAGGDGLSFDFGNLRLDALSCVNLSVVSVILIGGVLKTKRTFEEISGELPLEVESRELGLALLRWIVDHGRDKPLELVHQPEWLVEGRRYRHLLPWEQERAAWAARDRCDVRRDWLRVALKTLGGHLRTVQDDEPMILKFDGEVLTLRCAGNVIAMAGEGHPWGKSYVIGAGALRRLPKRLMSERVEVSIFGSDLCIGRHRFSGVGALEIEDEI